MVSTLRFWTPAKSAAGAAKPQEGPGPVVVCFADCWRCCSCCWPLRNCSGAHGKRPGSDHILLLDRSAWSAQQQADSQGPVLDEEKRLARRISEAAFRGRDRVLVARVSGIASPVTSFTSDRAKLLKAIDDTETDFPRSTWTRRLSLRAKPRPGHGQAGRCGLRWTGPVRQRKRRPRSSPEPVANYPCGREA